MCFTYFLLSWTHVFHSPELASSENVHHGAPNGIHPHTMHANSLCVFPTAKQPNHCTVDAGMDKNTPNGHTNDHMITDHKMGNGSAKVHCTTNHGMMNDFTISSRVHLSNRSYHNLGNLAPGGSSVEEHRASVLLSQGYDSMCYDAMT